jgi:hypothetical protein
MKVFRLFFALAAAALAVSAKADITVVQKLTIENPQLQAAMQSMSPEQKAQMAKMGVGGTMQTTTYISGHKSRTDIGAFNSTIVDQSNGKVIVLNRQSHTYSTRSLSTVEKKAAKGATASVKATGKTKVILGHLCRDYHVSVDTPSLPGGSISGDIWAAPDLPQPALAAVSGGVTAALESEWHKIDGMPLKMSLLIAGSEMGDTTVKTNAVSISTTPVAASVFSIPAGYQPGPTYSPGMGGAMGGSPGQ